MADPRTIKPGDVTHEHFWHVFSNLLTPLIMFVVLPVLGIVGYFIFGAFGFDLRGALARDSVDGLQVSGMVVLLFIATAACLGVSGFVFIRELLPWRRPTA